MATDVTPVTQNGRRRLSDETRAKLRAGAQARFAALTPEQQEAQRARLRRGAPPPPAPVSGGPRNPLDDAPRARPVGTPAASRGVGAPPRFEVPPLPPLELGPDDGAGLEDLPQPTPDELAGFAVDVDQVAELLAFPFDMLADRRGDHWRLRPHERERLAGALTRKINQHAVAARALEAGGDWILIVGGFAVIISARLAEDARHARPTQPDNGARPGLAGLRVVAGSAGRGAPSAAAGSRPDAVPMGRDAARPGSLNGVGTDAGDGDQAAPAAAPDRPLVQTFPG